MATENKGIYFTELTLKNIRCFGDEAVLKLSNDKGEWTKWNVILGDNGTGKTTLLQCLAATEIVEYYDIDIKRDTRGVKLYLTRRNINFNKIDPDLEKPYNDNFNLNTRIQSQLINLNNGEQEYTLLAQSKYANKIEHTSISNRDFNHPLILGYGASRRISFNIFSKKEIYPDNSETLFDDDAKLVNVEEWLYQMDYSASFAESNDTEFKEDAILKRNLVFKIIVEILPDVEAIDVVLEGSPGVPVIKFKTSFGWVGISELSYGYKTMLAWIVDVAARMFKRYPNSQNPLEEPVVILVDEIDLHLHPKWQRQIFEFLETRFPRAQFIVTAHSPLIVQSAPKDANIIVLKKEKVGAEYVVKIDNDKNYVRNWRVDQILASDLFDEVGVRNSDIEKQMDERRTLLKKEKLTDTEKVRLDELNKIAYNLPSAESIQDIKAMDIIREAAEYLKNNKKSA